MMKSQGKNIRYFADDFFTSHSVKELGEALNHNEYSYYHDKIRQALIREGDQYRAEEQKRISDFQAKVEQDKERAMEQVMKKYQSLPAPIRPTKEKTIQDIKHLVGQPFIGDYTYQERLKEYVGEVEGGNLPADISPEGKQYDTKKNT